MASLNKVQIIGNLGNDPDVKYTQSDTCVTTISIATTKKWKDKDGNPQERTEWHRVKLWNKLGEIAGEYLRKGGSVYIEGELQYGSYQHQDGHTVYTTDIIASEMKMLGSRPEGGSERQGGQQQRQAPRQEYGGGGGGGYGQQRQGAQEPSRRESPQQQSAPPMDDFADDDIPF